MGDHTEKFHRVLLRELNALSRTHSPGQGKSEDLPVTITPSQAKALTSALAQLRHSFKHLHAGTVGNQPQFARGLIAPAIRAIEDILKE